jgi:hypothetical protein
MTIDKLFKVRIAMKQGRSKDYVRQKLNMYMKAYDKTDHDVCDKLLHKNLMFDYWRYINKSGDSDRKK